MRQQSANRNGKLSFTTIAGVTLMVMGLTAATAQAQWHYHYFKEKRALPLDAKRVAVFEDGGRTGNSRFSDPQTAAQLGIVVNDVTPLVVSGWSFVGSAADRRTPAGIEQVVRRMSDQQAADFISPVFVGTDGGYVIVMRDIFVGFHSDVSAARAEAILDASQAGTIRDRGFTNMPSVYRLRASSRNGFDVLAAANRLAQRPEVKFAEPDMLFTGRPALIPNDPGFSNCWGLHNTGQFGGSIPDMDMDAPEAWEMITGDPSIIVAIFDNGVQQDHPDLNQIGGFDSTSQGGDGGPHSQCDNHGTAVAGCVSAIINNNLGTVGVAPNCKVMSVRTAISSVPCDGFGSVASSWVFGALSWSEIAGARVTNFSWGLGFSSSLVTQKYSDTRQAGMIHFAAAGNESSSSISYPARISSVNSVAALSPAGTLASFSNWGNGLALSAPGVNVYTTDRTGTDGTTGGDYAFVNGTSFAAPYAAGVAALVLSADATLTGLNVEQILYDSAVDRGALGYDTTYGWGFVNARRAVCAAAEESFPDMCTCTQATAAVDNPAIVNAGFGGAPRFLSTLAGDPGHIQAIRVIFSDPMPAPYEDWGGLQMWLGPPERYCENSGTGAAPNDTPPNYGCDPAPGLPERSYVASTLQCDPYFMDWHGRCVADTCSGGMRDGRSCLSDSDCLGPVYVFHGGIIPSTGPHNEPTITPTSYAVQVVDEICSLSDPANYSSALTQTTSKWGDTVENLSVSPYPSPEGIVGITDVLGILKKFQNDALASVSARVDMIGAASPKHLPDHQIDIGDVLQALFAFQGMKWPASCPACEVPEPNPRPCP